MSWIFQGNPKRFAIDEYIARYPELIYWYTPRYGAEIKLGDRVYLWRSGVDSGVIASGVVVEEPRPGENVRHPQALGSELWSTESPNPKELKTGIRVDDMRLTLEEGLLPREAIKSHPELTKSKIIRMPNGTIFRLTRQEAAVIQNIWSDRNRLSIPGVPEGERKLRAHYIRERSGKLRSLKLAHFMSIHGNLYCELCGERTSARYPLNLGLRAFEVHHKKPLSLADTPVRTLLEDLAVLCANCHRTVHSNAEVDANYSTLAKHFCNG